MRGINLREDWGWSNAPRIPMGAAILGGSAISGLSSLVGSGKASSAASKAAGQSAQAQELATQAQEQMYVASAGRLNPFTAAGQNALDPMAAVAGQTPGQQYLDQSQQYLQQAAGMNPNQVLTEAGLEQTPGYQFTLQQGLKATQAAQAAKGLGVSGASLKGAATYATGLADATYSNRFSEAQQAYADVLGQGTYSLGQVQQAQAQQQQQYAQYGNIASLGENAAAMTGNQGVQTGASIGSNLLTGAGQIGNYLTQAGQAQAAGTAGVGSAFNQGIQNYLGYNQFQQYNQNLANYTQTLAGSQTAGFAAPGTAGGYNQGYDLLSPTTGGLTLPPVPPQG